jgi:drug/metabolite transporter (DMT)-like permease
VLALHLGPCAAGALSAALARWGASVPVTQSMSTYLLLFCAFYPRPHREGWHQPHWKYFCLATLDVSSTWCLVKALSLTSLTSATLLDSWTVPCVMLLTYAIFRQRCAAPPRATRASTARRLGCCAPRPSHMQPSAQCMHHETGSNI